jgi:uncharacterized protein
MKIKFTLFNIALGLIILTIVLIISLLLFFKPTTKHVKRDEFVTDTRVPEPKPVFRKDGELSFLSHGKEKELAKIDIEIADEQSERMQGLMYRDSMPENNGMLFLFDVEEPLSFWMKNTKISLDIIYISSDHRVVSISPNTEPYSLDHIPSNKPAMFVVEVNAGFAQRHGIQVGDRVAF